MIILYMKILIYIGNTDMTKCQVNFLKNIYKANRRRFSGLVIDRMIYQYKPNYQIYKPLYQSKLKYQIFRKYHIEFQDLCILYKRLNLFHRMDRKHYLVRSRIIY